MSNPRYPRGSEWRKWDLHVHTPSSLIHNYPGPDPWENFLHDLENLPPEYKVIGVNDYLFLDGYKRILVEKEKGRLTNIDLFLPVIELRLDKFGGSAGHLSRVNFHIIFSNEVSPETIEQQFLNALNSKYVLSPQYDHFRTNGKWAAIPTKDSLTDLGNMIIQTVPEAARSKFSPPLIEGFNNLCINLDHIEKALQSHYFENKYLTAVGKTEWADIKWNDHSIAEKKTIINSAHFVFISAESIEAWQKASNSLSAAGVNPCLLDCSDAHELSTSPNKDRIGKCFTWIKSDPTFEGLRQTVIEPKGRIFIGELPPSIERARSKPTRIVQSITIRKLQNSPLKEKWFDCDLQLNAELVAIIGNKGSGKSALADVLGLLGNTPRSNSFSFLRPDRFREPTNNKAKHFEASLFWADGSSEGPITLDQDPDPQSVEKIKYIPQNYLEEICNEVGHGRESRFYTELQQVIFSHVPESERLGFDNLDALLSFRGEELAVRIDILLEELHQINHQIVVREERLLPRYKRSLELQLEEKRRELHAHEQRRPKEVVPPSADPTVQKQSQQISTALELKRQELQGIEASINDCKKRDAQLAKQQATANKLLERLNNLKHQIFRSLAEVHRDLQELGLQDDNLISFTINDQAIFDILNQVNTERASIAAQLDPKRTGSLVQKKMHAESEIRQLQNALSAPERAYQEYLQKLRAWEIQRASIQGSPDMTGSIENLEAQLTKIREIPNELRRLYRERNRMAIQILQEKHKLRERYETYYRPIQKFLGQHEISARANIQVAFNVSMVESGFTEGFLSKINQRKTGSFAGIEEGTAEVRCLLNATDWNSLLSVLRFTRKLIKKLKNYDGRSLEISEQLRQGVSVQELYDYIYSFKYLSPIYQLTWENKRLEQLSPGERGNLLLIFYLLVDRDDIPLVIDQPEENLDNQTVVRTLVPCVKDAKRRRQIVMVTHNPNLAVVCDAEQIIYAQIYKERGNEVRYLSGSIEDPLINEKIVDVLEGTRPAFDKRDEKYLP